jgi:hypothetical protein
MVHSGVKMGMAGDNFSALFEINGNIVLRKILQDNSLASLEESPLLGWVNSPPGYYGNLWWRRRPA